MQSCSYILVVVVVLPDRAHLQGVGGSRGAAVGGSLLAQVGSLQQGDRTSATEGRKTSVTVQAHCYDSKGSPRAPTLHNEP